MVRVFLSLLVLNTQKHYSVFYFDQFTTLVLLITNSNRQKGHINNVKLGHKPKQNGNTGLRVSFFGLSCYL